jgi:hypothetical protein
MKNIVMGYLQEGPQSFFTIKAKSACRNDYIRTAIKELHADGEIFISSWGQLNKTGPYHAIYTAGNGDDARKPFGTNKKDRSLVPKRDPFDCLFFGEYKPQNQGEVNDAV